MAFFQLLMHGGIFHSFCSLTVTLRVGECITGAGGEGGPLGIFLLILKKKNISISFLSYYSFYFSLSLEFRRLNWIHLSLHHSDDPLFGAGIEGLSLLRGRVTNVLGRALFLRASDGHRSGNLRVGDLLQGLLRSLGNLVDLLLRWLT